MKSGRENYLYRESGLARVTLLGIEVGRCPRCGEHEALIPNILGLHEAIAAALARKTARLLPEEVRFLRKQLGWSGGDFAAHLGVSRETVSRWETGAAAMGTVAERLLRLATATRGPGTTDSLSMLREVGRGRPAHASLLVALKKGAWSAQAA
jgi:putative zinc finger/helix-turn-helix YgiT family protein